MKKRCLYCYKELNVDEIDFHATCSKKMFGEALAPELPYNEDEMGELASQVILRQTTVTGVQPKLSLHLATEAERNRHKMFTIVGLWGGYIY
jgi:serine/threonine-protein kinase HipA